MPVGRFGTMRWKLTSGNRLVGGCMVMSFELSVTQKTKGYQRLTYRSYSSRSCGIGDFMDEILGMGKLFLRWTSSSEAKQFEMAVVVDVIILVGVIIEIVGFVGVDFVLVIIA